jgi:hypothetical protein
MITPIPGYLGQPQYLFACILFSVGENSPPVYWLKNGKILKSFYFKYLVDFGDTGYDQD